MDRRYSYKICIAGHLSDGWSDWFEGLMIFRTGEGDTILSGPLPDQAALIGILTKINALNLTLLSFERAIEQN